MANYVPDEGTGRERLVLIEESPGEREDATLRPFVGASGSTLADWWRQVGLQRSDFYITNVCPFRPPNNDISKIPAADMARYVEELHGRLAALEDPWLIVPTGNTALAALTGKKGILKHRGSIYGYDRAGLCNGGTGSGDRGTTERGQQVAGLSESGESIYEGAGVKVIPTIHPAATFREPKLVKRCLRDWSRIAGDVQFRELRLPQREHYIRPTLADVEHFCRLVEQEADVLALDIETPRGIWTCIGFSYCPEFSITIPLTKAFWGAATDTVWSVVSKLLISDVPKVMQNGLFDSYYINWYGLEVANWQWDTLAMHHSLDPVDEHSLAYMASIDTREPYWKDEAKDPDEMAKYARYDDAFWTYNGKDVAVTCELKETYQTRMANEQQLQFYQRHYRDMFAPLLGMSLSGIRLDEGRREARHEVLVNESAACLERLAGLAGEPLHAKTGLSPIKLKRFMYETLRLPQQKSRSTGNVTTDEAAIRKLMRRYPEKFGQAGQEILNFRRKSKLATFMTGGLADDDGYVRCQYRFTTDTGRLSSSSNPRGSGLNLQNIDREARDIFFPRPGHVLLARDLSQAESRVVGVLTGDEELIRLARTPPWEFDVHTYNASIIFGISLERVSKEQRYLGKRAVHASNYGMGENKLSEVLLLDGYFFTPAQCRGMIAAYMTRFPAILEWQKDTRHRIIKDRILQNSWGRRYDFTYTRLDDAAYRQGYCFVPQSEVADIENQWGVIPTHHFLAQEQFSSVLMAQVHDELLVSAAPDEAWDIAEFMRTSLERPRLYRGVELAIPSEVAIGTCWADKQGFARPPAKEEFNERVRDLLQRGTVLHS